MKKIIFTLLFMIVSFCTLSAQQIYTYRTTSFASATVYNRSYVWSDWESSDMIITINTNTDIVKIYSPVTQIYKIIQDNGKGYDESGGRYMSFKFVDQDGDMGEIRIRQESNGNTQIYIYFNNVAWVYNVISI